VPLQVIAALAVFLTWCFAQTTPLVLRLMQIGEFVEAVVTFVSAPLLGAGVLLLRFNIITALVMAVAISIAVYRLK
jgi:hypothetical protein